MICDRFLFTGSLFTGDVKAIEECMDQHSAIDQ
jgi:hypothetical protein